MAWRSDWANDLKKVISSAESAERDLSYLTPCQSELARKAIGSYYTPADVARFFWAEFFGLTSDPSDYQMASFWTEHHFIEPSAGAGALIFSLLREALSRGLSPNDLSSFDLTVIDINQDALSFVQSMFEQLEASWGIKFPNIRYINQNFLDCALPVSPKKPFFFGNPPFVTNERGGKWKNLYADFLERALVQGGDHGKCHFILPLSFAFSRDYEALRSLALGTGKTLALSSFDNIPDTLFASGKPEHTNTNKANSQRCSILSVFPAERPRVLSTKLHRWRKSERTQLLSSSPTYHDISDCEWGNQFIRPENAQILQYISDNSDSKRIRDFVAKDGPLQIFVAPVGRNFIGLRDEDASASTRLTFESDQQLNLVLLLLSSDLFLGYWRTVGDGFHITKGNILDFPVSKNVERRALYLNSLAIKLWTNRDNYAKLKRHPRGFTKSYDFSGDVPTLFEDV